jgi:hypothetical protein
MTLLFRPHDPGEDKKLSEHKPIAGEKHFCVANT